ncbi:serine hydrolase [Streptomyces sp. NPDC057136]|uniref:D-alanyl-D-alanine carboxypeptidase n=1 Tax=Streptomyces sp. NPDC057136 TaxID=3346029 RepID=UPI003627A51B
MAGESPDKSEQRKSSGTAAEERDPRLAVFREPAASTDDATAVFRTLTPKEAADDVAESTAEDSAGSGDAVGGPEDGSTPSGGAGEPSGADGAAEAAEAAEAAVTAEADADAEPDAESDTESDADAGSEPGDARLRAAVAAWVASGDDDGAASGDGDGDGEAHEEPAEPAASADAVEPTDSATSAGTAEAAEPAEVAEADKPSEPAAADPADSSEPADDAEPAESTESPKSAEPTESAKSTDADKPADLADPADPVGDQRGIDQPTAVFKAVEPARVDQPTTALKIPAPKPKPKPETPKPETPAERTSKFVPLRSDDVRPVSAPAIGPTVTPDVTPGRGDGPGRPAAPSWAASLVSAEAPAPALSGAERTRQQPLPPRPPLDLLAELTNTPPPEETPVRNAVRRVKIWTPLLLLVVVIFAIAQMVRPLPTPELRLTAEPTYTFQGDPLGLSWPGQGQSAVTVDGVGSLGSEGAQKPAPIASVAKVMTAYVILREHPLKGDEPGEMITVDQRAEDESKLTDESTAPLKKGQKLSQRDLLQLLMIPSGNNAARLFARWDSPTDGEFVDKMNDAAKDLGMTGTTYTDPSGLEKTTVSTAADQLKLAQAVMQNEVFREIVDMPEVQIEGVDTKIYNNNTLLLEPGVSGIKTGSSTPAGGCLLWSANTVVDGKTHRIYGVVMGQQAGTGRLYDSLTLSLTNGLKLIQDSQKAVTSATVVKKGDVVGYVDDGFGRSTPVVATKNLKAVGWSGLKVELSVTDSGKEISHTAPAGTEVGMVTVGTGAGKVSAPVALQGDLTEPAFGDKLTRIS